MKPTCKTCKHWLEEKEPPGRMPGVTEEHRICTRPRMTKSQPEWRRPTDWCHQYEEDA